MSAAGRRSVAAIHGELPQRGRVPRGPIVAASEPGGSAGRRRLALRALLRTGAGFVAVSGAMPRLVLARGPEGDAAAAGIGQAIATAPGGTRGVSSPIPAPIPAPLLRALHAGGCVLVIRHAATEPGTGDPPGFSLDDCRTQRNLSDEGRRRARALGESLRRERVPIGPVRSSRWCRCIDTAKLAFGVAEPWPALDSVFADRTVEPQRTAEVKDWATRFAGPANAVLVTHQVNAVAIAGRSPQLGEVLVLKSHRGGLRLLGRVGV